MDVRVADVVVRVYDQHLMTSVHLDLQQVVTVAVAAEVDILSRPLPAIHIAPADIEAHAGFAWAVSAVRGERVGLLLVERVPVREELVRRAETQLLTATCRSEQVARARHVEQLEVEEVQVVVMPVLRVELELTCPAEEG